MFLRGRTTSPMSFWHTQASVWRISAFWVPWSLLSTPSFPKVTFWPPFWCLLVAFGHVFSMCFLVCFRCPFFMSFWCFLTSFWPPFGSLLAPFGSLFAPFGSLWLPLAPLGPRLAPSWPPWLPFGSLLHVLVSRWLPFGSLLAPFWYPFWLPEASWVQVLCRHLGRPTCRELR